MAQPSLICEYAQVSSALLILDSNTIFHMVRKHAFHVRTKSTFHHLYEHEHDLNAEYATAIGIWPALVSVMNHACMPNTCRAHIGDMMIIHANQDIPAKTELTTAYLPIDHHLKSFPRGYMLNKRYDMGCNCTYCVHTIQGAGSPTKERDAAIADIRENFLSSLATHSAKNDDIVVSALQLSIHNRLDVVEQTYLPAPATECPRFELSKVYLLFMAEMAGNGWFGRVLSQAIRHFEIMGFDLTVEMDYSDESKEVPACFIVKRWGFMHHDLIETMMHIRIAFKMLDVTEEAMGQLMENYKIIYRCILGEEESLPLFLKSNKGSGYTRLGVFKEYVRRFAP